MKKETKSKSKKLAPSKRNTRAAIQIAARARAVQRRGAVEKASQMLRYYGVEHERGDSLIVAHRFKVLIAFDSDDILVGIKKHAKAIDSQVVHIPAHLFRKPAQFQKAINDAIGRKPIYAKGHLIQRQDK